MIDHAELIARLTDKDASAACAFAERRPQNIPEILC